VANGLRASTPAESLDAGHTAAPSSLARRQRGSKITAMKHDHPADPVRRRLSLALLATTLAPLLPARGAAPVVEVWTGPSCSCCHGWIKHLEINGFAVTSHDGGNGDARTRLGMPIDFGSCHTGAVDGYALEGHVPAREIRRLLAEGPDAIGLSVPGMPRGSPGMESPVHDPYDVLLVARDGRASVFQGYR